MWIAHFSLARYVVILGFANTEIDYIFDYPHGIPYCCSVPVCIMVVIILGRNVLDGVTPLIPQWSVVSLHALTNIPSINLASSASGISSNTRSSFFPFLLYASILPYRYLDFWLGDPKQNTARILNDIWLPKDLTKFTLN